MKLVIIESPGKKDALQKYLGKEYEVVSSKGHVRDLPVKTLGVDMNHNFEPMYEITSDKKQVVNSLKSKAEKAEKVLLAADPDREGEAIAWHIAECLGIDEETECRIEFNEISKNAVNEALTKPRKINKRLVDAQQARRILDRIVGYKVSPIICKKIQPKLSAGRVQSVCLKMVVDREKEIREFVPEEYWNIYANVKKDGNKTVFKVNLATQNGKKIKVGNKEDADKVIATLKQEDMVVSSLKKSKLKQHAPAPFTTSTMQQDALNKLGMNLKKTSSCAQQLYEGVELGPDGKTALITYIRTDSTRVSTQAQNSARDFIKEKYGQEFVPEKPNVYNAKKSAQDAHEAIRPISLNITPNDIKDHVQIDIYKLYKLIYERFLASQMIEAIYNNVTVDVNCQEYGLKAVGKTLEFAGYTAVYKDYTETKEKDEKEENAKIPSLEVGDVLVKEDVKGDQKFTKPPQRYTEASLVKAMEEKGIGRPATYTPTITILYTRSYVEKDGKYIIPTQLGENVSKYLEQFFKSIFNVKFTAYMEERLDDIAEVGEDWHEVIASFWKGFKDLLKRADESSVTIKQQPVESDVICDKCGSKMLIREGKFGKFLGCSNFPKCRNILNLNDDKTEKGVCPVCGKDAIQKKSKNGKIFYGCSGYPECNFMSWDLPTGAKCEKCASYMIKDKKNNIKCSKCSWTK